MRKIISLIILLVLLLTFTQPVFAEVPDKEIIIFFYPTGYTAYDEMNHFKEGYQSFLNDLSLAGINARVHLVAAHTEFPKEVKSLLPSQLGTDFNLMVARTRFPRDVLKWDPQTGERIEFFDECSANICNISFITTDTCAASRDLEYNKSLEALMERYSSNNFEDKFNSNDKIIVLIADVFPTHLPWLSKNLVPSEEIIQKMEGAWDSFNTKDFRYIPVVNKLDEYHMKPKNFFYNSPKTRPYSNWGSNFTFKIINTCQSSSTSTYLVTQNQIEEGFKESFRRLANKSNGKFIDLAGKPEYLFEYLKGAIIENRLISSQEAQDGLNITRTTNQNQTSESGEAEEEIVEDIITTEGCNLKGACALNYRIISNGIWGECQIQPTTEICDGIDNDCDGEIDNGFECIQNAPLNTDNDMFCTETCELPRETVNCLGSIPTNAIPNCNGPCEYTKTFFPEGWTEDFVFTHGIESGTCKFKCRDGYKYNTGNYCEEIITSPNKCGGADFIPENSDWNDYGFYGIYYPQDDLTQQEQTARYSETAEICAWTCKDGYYYDEETTDCIFYEESAFCTNRNYVNNNLEIFKWNIISSNGTFTQYLINREIFPETKEINFGDKNESCYYSCVKEEKKCNLDQATYCGEGIKYCGATGWSNTCETTNAMQCTSNQFCNNEKQCAFCSDGLKNCDMNLMTACETNINNDRTNCGDCGITCDTNELCFEGNCMTEYDKNQILIERDTAHLTICDTLECGPNSTCNQELETCLCEIGRNNCDSNWLTGCETTGSCNVLESECSTNNDCSFDEKCEDGQCVTIDSDITCNRSSDCLSNEKCYNNICISVLCEDGYVAVNHECVCQGTVCGNKCYTSEGICCDGKWQEQIDTCLVNITEQERIVESSNDLIAKQLINNAKKSIENGELAKGKTEAMLAELKSKISQTQTPEEYEYYYRNALTAMNNERYLDAQSEIENGLNFIGTNGTDSSENTNYILPIIIIIVLIVGGITGYFIYQKKFNIEEKEEVNTEEEFKL